MAARDVVLLVTHTQDVFTIDRVAEAVRILGGRPVRLDSDRFPAEVRLAATQVASRTGVQLTVDDVRVLAEDVGAVWVRKIRRPRLDAGLDERYRAACASESHAALLGILDGLGGRWLDRPDRSAAAENKPLQLRLAARHGLAVPRTLLTNDPDEVRRFAGEIAGELVTKLLLPLSHGMSGSGPTMPTSVVPRSALDQLEGLRHCPMMFQERIANEADLRVAYVGGRTFAGALPAAAHGRVDWRRSAASFARAELPDEVIRGLGGLMDELGLGFGAIDLIRTPDGRHVFLEVNPGGEWGMLERDLDLPISRAIAEWLVAGAAEPRR